ncbi:hypothetical protein B7C62_31985 [Kitasatospora albolonga]|uniref:Subtilisin inhibitor domain-containing protein n=1 Tax=Kitasatospora albolonga TaxID=68173 RepID=A0ABC8C1K7_9ACTN|nr:hypothetical protein B7C62_31985 [Kitasatospora albolonga]
MASAPLVAPAATPLTAPSAIRPPERQGTTSAHRPAATDPFRPAGQGVHVLRHLLDPERLGLGTATADGPRGTFTAARLVCVGHGGHTTCEWSGTFRSADGIEPEACTSPTTTKKPVKAT